MKQLRNITVKSLTQGRHTCSDKAPPGFSNYTVKIPTLMSMKTKLFLNYKVLRVCMSCVTQTKQFGAIL